MKAILNIKTSIISAASCCLISAPGIALAVSCGDIISTAEVLDADISNCAISPAITIMGPTGSLDLNGFSLSCDGLAGTGILLEGTTAVLINSQASSGIITSCDIGVSVEGSGLHNVIGVTTQENGSLGMSVSSSRNIVSGSINDFNFGNGIIVLGDWNSFFEVSATSNGEGGIIISGDNNQVFQSTARNNTFSGIAIQDANYTNIILNTTSSNNEYGISVSNFGQVGNFVTGNTAESNDIDDLFDDNTPACVGTTWYGNIFSSSNDACIN
ncbi:NosD domain-containing protein [Microbulbifer sp. MKSA007]|nr:NosD domain-containing protein [Microbulbifer sp. MKSA007]